MASKSPKKDAPSAKPAAANRPTTKDKAPVTAPDSTLLPANLPKAERIERENDLA